ncbi:MAG TPA: aspartate aminotransferase family protein [Anaeromyxobacter sp.]|nr:aspartate aminotransferase family protein [Anaeromyxobacter sp.]
MDRPSLEAAGPARVLSFEEALARSGREAFDAFASHVSPIGAGLLRRANMDKRYTRAEGPYLYDEAGRPYLDLTAGCGALGLGHNPPEVLDAVQRARSHPAVLIMGYSPLQGALAEALASLLPGELSVACFGNGGAEAVELALRTARAATRRRRFLFCEGGYHGLSLGAMSVSGSPRYRQAFGPLLEPCASVPFGDLGALEGRLADGDVAAFIIEPVQGEGGAVVPPEGFLAAAGEACRAHGALLIVDEIQTGFGRTGRLFAIEHDGVVPDVVVLSKSLSAGVVPTSVCVTTPEIWDRAFGTRDRFDLTISTFGGNPAACAASLKAIEITLRQDLAGRARILGERARAGLEELAKRHETVKAIRGRGLLLGVELRPPASVSALGMQDDYVALVASCLLNDRGILTTWFDLAPAVLRFEPPLIVTEQEIDQAIEALDHVLGLGAGRLALSLGKGTLSRMFKKSETVS